MIPATSAASRRSKPEIRRVRRLAYAHAGQALKAPVSKEVGASKRVIPSQHGRDVDHVASSAVGRNAKRPHGARERGSARSSTAAIVRSSAHARSVSQSAPRQAAPLERTAYFRSSQRRASDSLSKTFISRFGVRLSSLNTVASALPLSLSATIAERIGLGIGSKPRRNE